MVLYMVFSGNINKKLMVRQQAGTPAYPDSELTENNRNS